MEYAVERALGFVREELGSDQRGTDAARLAAIQKEQENLARLTARTGALDVYAGILEELEQERLELQARLDQMPVNLDPELLRPQIGAVVTDLRNLLSGSPDEGRAALLRLFADQKLRVQPHEERGFSVEGFATLDLGLPLQATGGAGDRTRTCTPEGNSS